MQTDAQKRAKNKYNKSHYVMLSVRLKPEEMVLLDEFLQQSGESKNSFVRRIILKAIGREEQAGK